MFDAYKRFLRFAGEQKGTWYKGMAFELLRSIFEALQFVALLVVLRSLVEQNMTGATLWMAFGIMAASVAGAALCWYLAHNSEGHANYRMCAEKRIHIGERMKYMPMGYFNAQSLGSLTAAATSTMEDLESMSFAVIARTVVGIIRTTIFSLAILCFDWRIGLVFLLGMLLFLWVNSLLLKKSRELSPGRLAAQTRLVDAVLEYIQGMSVVRAFHGDKAANQTLNRTIEETEQQNFKLERKRIPYNVLEQIVLRVTAVAAILLSIWFFLQGSMTLFTCLMVVVSAFLVYSELESAGEMFFMLPMIDASIDRVEEIDRAPRMDEGGSVQTPKHCGISFEHVDFSYGERKIIRDVSFTIPEGTTTAIVGPSGSGKTTLTSLMARFWDVDSGAVKLGGIDVKDYTLDSLMRNFSMHRPQAVLGLAMMLLVFLVMLLAPVFAPNDPMQLNVAHSFAPPDAQYPLGTDELGRCILSRLIYGARASLSIALPTLLLLAVISTVVATLCAYIGGVLDRIFEVVSNIFMAFPPFLVAITLVGLFESKAASIVLSIVIAMWVWNARVVRTHVLRERNQPYVITCRMSGCSELRIVFRHIIPNILPHLLVLYSTGLSSIIIMISSYAFLGLGLETGTAEWGAMFVNANKLMFSHPQFLVYPGLCILFAAAGFNLFGEALRDICAPREG